MRASLTLPAVIITTTTELPPMTRIKTTSPVSVVMPPTSQPPQTKSMTTTQTFDTTTEKRLIKPPRMCGSVVDYECD
jgi:hypothetical protein